MGFFTKVNMLTRISILFQEGDKFKFHLGISIPPASFLTPSASGSKISDSCCKYTLIHIPGKKSPSVIKRNPLLWEGESLYPFIY